MMEHAIFGTVFTMLDGITSQVSLGQQWRSGSVMVAEAALRSAVMGVVVYGVLQVFRVRQVRAQRYAWVLALLAALAMPALVKLPQPALRLPTASQLPKANRAVTVHSSAAPAGGVVVRTPAARLRTRSLSPQHHGIEVAQPQLHSGSRVESSMRFSAREREWLARIAAGFTLRGSGVAALIYFSVAGVLLLRLALGVALTWQVREQSVRAEFSRQDDIRLSARMKTPVTIGRTIVLPENALQWDADRLRVVLAHERAHVRQRDSWFLLLANVHCALFWFSPFSWWLQRRLCALGEAMADLAAVGAAESRATYAQVLLEFASAGHQPAGAVAMARASNLRPRIERLLNERLFRESVGERKRLAYVAAGVVPLAMLASASLVRVHAAVKAAPTSQAQTAAAKTVTMEAANAAVMVPVSGSVQADIHAENQVAAQTEIHVENQAEKIANASTELAMAVKDALVRQDQQVEGGAPPPAPVGPTAAEAPSAPQAPEPATAGATSHAGANVHVSRSDSDGGWPWNGDSTTLVTGDDHVSFGGGYNERYREIRRKVQGDFFLYQHDGKDYVIQDKAFLDKVRALYRPMEELGKQQEALGRQQEALGRQQEALGRRQEAVSVPTPDMSKELAELTAATAKLKDLQGTKTIDRESLAELQGKIGDIQGRLGELQGLAGQQQGKLGEEQGKLGEQQGKLGEEQGKLGARQGELGRQAQEKLKPMIDEALKNGTARAID